MATRIPEMFRREPDPCHSPDEGERFKYRYVTDDGHSVEPCRPGPWILFGPAVKAAGWRGGAVVSNLKRAAEFIEAWRSRQPAQETAS